MAFEIIKAEDRLANMLVWLGGLQNKITDFIVGGKTRTKLETICVEMEQQDFATEQLIRKAIPTSAYYTFNFPLLAATRAYGQVTFTASPTPTTQFTIPAGTRVTTTAGNITYETVADIIVQASQTTATADIICTSAGASGNTGSATITVIQTAIPGITAVTNAAAVGGGKPIESEAERRARFNAYITTLPRTTSAGVAYGAMTARLTAIGTGTTDPNGTTTERVVSVRVAEPPATGSAGSATVYIYNGVNGASNDLIAECQKVINGYRDDSNTPVAGYKAAGVVLTVNAATTVPTVCSMSISVLPGYTLATIKSQAITAIETYFASLGVAAEFVRNEMIQRIMNIDGVYNLEMPFPDVDVVPLAYQVVTLNTTLPMTDRVSVSTWTG